MYTNEFTLNKCHVYIWLFVYWRKNMLFLLSFSTRIVNCYLNSNSTAPGFRLYDKKTHKQTKKRHPVAITKCLLQQVSAVRDAFNVPLSVCSQSHDHSTSLQQNVWGHINEVWTMSREVIQLSVQLRSASTNHHLFRRKRLRAFQRNECHSCSVFPPLMSAFWYCSHPLIMSVIACLSGET